MNSATGFYASFCVFSSPTMSVQRPVSCPAKILVMPVCPVLYPKSKHLDLVLKPGSASCVFDLISCISLTLKGQGNEADFLGVL
jgi:hypothetical protein